MLFKKRVLLKFDLVKFGLSMNNFELLLKSLKVFKEDSSSCKLERVHCVDPPQKAQNMFQSKKLRKLAKENLLAKFFKKQPRVPKAYRTTRRAWCDKRRFLNLKEPCPMASSNFLYRPITICLHHNSSLVAWTFEPLESLRFRSSFNLSIHLTVLLVFSFS